MKEKGFDLMNTLGSQKIPFIFFTSFDKSKMEVFPVSDLQNNPAVMYDFEGLKNFSNLPKSNIAVLLKPKPLTFKAYHKQFQKVQEALKQGNSYLLNLTTATPISCNLSMLEIFSRSQARFRLYVRDQFVCFSPEKFITIENNQIHTFPMKGTIDATIPNAEEIILADEKEMAEHNTIVDLLRNDISMVATNTTVEKYRYIDKLTTHKGDLLQVSSHIKADLKEGWQHEIGTILDKLTPAGSICGAPKQKTCELIEQIETHNRNFYTGVCGIFTGDEVKSGVMIRFIEKTETGLVFKSGGGIHHLSKVEDEYKELIQKIYLPF